MKTEVTAGIMLIIIMASTLSIGFNVMPTEADSYIDQFSDQNYLRNANADSIVEPDAQDFGPDQKETAEGNSTTRPTTENKWTFNSTNEWTDFANVDEDSAELVVGVNNTKPDSYAQITALIAENGGQIINTVSIGGEIVAVVADMPFEAMSSFVQEVRATGLSRYVEPNLKFRTNLIPNDPYWPLQWGPAKIEADYAWNTTIGDPSVLVAVIDTGIDWNHPDLVDNYVPLGYDWVNMDSDPMDDHGHGTHCAGIIAATLNNDVGVAGLAQISIAAEKALDAGGWGTEDDLASAIIHAVDQGADILSNSWSSYGESALIHEAVQYAYEHDVLIVAAAGNDAGSTELYPAAYDEVIAVTATDQYDDPAWWTNFGDWVELAAPGVDIYSTVWNDGYTYMSGTSMSTPHVAGVAALILSKFPNMTRDRARLQLRFTADDLGDSGFDHYYGYGRVNARRAVEQAPTDHDLLILNWDRPRFVELHDLAIVNTTVFNFGTSNETDITVQLLVNGSIVDFGIVDFLETATSVTVNCSWTPTTEGTYNLTSYVVPVPGETFTENNIVTAMVPAGHLKHILFDQTHRTDSIINYNIWVAALTERGYAVDTHTSGLITPTVLADYMAFIIPQAQDSYTPDELSSIQNFVIAGGGLLVIGDDAPSVYTDLTSFAGINWVSGGVYGITTDITPHEVTREVTSIYLDAPIAEMIVSGCAEDLVRDPGGGIMLAVSEQPGRVIGFADEGSLWDYGITYQDNLCLASNMIDWLVIRPEHDLAVTLETPPYIEPGDYSLLNVTVRNRGLDNEIHVDLFLFINCSAVKNVTIPELISDSSYTMDYLWMPAIEEGVYNITGYAVPVENEEITENNVASTYVYIGYPVKAFVLDSAGTDFSGIISTWQSLSTNWYMFGDKMLFVDYSTLNKEDIAYEDLAATDADVLIISCASDPGSGWEFTDLEIEAIDQYVHEGHGLIATSGTFYSMVPNNNKLAPLFGLDESTTWEMSYTNLLHLQDPTHPLFTNVPNPYTFPQTATTIPSDGRWDPNELTGGEYAALGHFQESAIVVYRGLVYISPLLEYGIPPYYHFHLQLLYNAITWSSYEKPEHELVTCLEAPPRLKPGESLMLNATFFNMGLNNETDVELFLLINSTVVNSTKTELLSGECYTINYLWTPTDEAIYNVTAYAPPVPDEEFTLNNIDTKMVLVREFVIENVLVYTDDYDVAPFERYPIVALDNLGITYTHYADDPSGFRTALTTQFWDLVIISHNNYYAFGNNWEELEEYVLDGGLLVLSTFDIDGSHSESTTLWSTLGAQWTSDMPYPEPVYRWTPTHPIFTIPNEVGDLTSYIEGYIDDGDHVTATSGIPIAGFTTSPATGYAAIVVGNGGRTVLISFAVCEFRYDEDADGKLDTVELWENAIAFLAIPVEHELTVTLDAPAYLRPDDSSLLNATVCNRGLGNETDVDLFLLINSTVVNSTRIPKLLAGECYMINYLWTPTDEAIYNVTAYAPPVPDENFIINNVKSVNISVTSTLVALFKNVNPWDLPSNEEAFSLYGVPYVVFSSSDFGTVDLDQFSKIVIASDQDQVFYNDMGTYRWWFEDYVRAGGILEIHAADFGWHGGQWVGTLPGGLLWVNLYADYVTITDPAHPVVTTPNMITDTELDYWHSSVHGVFSVYPVDCNIIVIEDSTSYPAYLEFEYGAGFILASSQTLEWANQHQYSRILENSLLYTPMKYEHDLGVTLEAPVFVELGNSTMLEVTVRNRGLSNETNVELHLLINGTLERNVTIQELLVGESYTISHVWTPAKTGNCNVTVYAPPVPDEEYITNNIATKEVHVFFYARQYLPHEWIDGGVPMGWHADDYSWAYTLPFDFPFYEIYFRTIYISSNGLITFTGPDSSCSNSIPSLAAKIAIAPAWDDWVTYNPHDIYIWQNSTHVGIRWYVASYGDRSIVANFEAVLAADGAIRFNYGHNNGPVSATIGISNGAGHILAEDKGSIHYVNSIVFTPFERNVAVYNVTVYPTKVYVGQTVSINVTVGNKGETPENLTVRVYYENASEYSNSTAFPTGIPNEPHPANAIWVEPSFTDLTNYSIGERFNVTAWLNLTEPSFAWQINLIYDKTILNATRCEYTANSQSQFFEGLPTIFIAPAFLNINVTHAYVIHAESLIGVAEKEPGSGSLSWIEFEIISKPPEPYEGYLELGIEPSETFVYDPELNEIPITRYHGVYGFGISPPPSPLIGEQKIYLLPGSNTTLTFAWNTTGMLLGNYTIKAVASSVPSEIDVEDNTFVDGVVEVLWQHDIAVIKVSPSRTWVYEGHTVDFNVTVRNEGDFTENVTIILYYNITAGHVIDIGTIENLHPQENKTVTLIWDTSGVTPCRNYTITAIATIPIESDVTDNTLESPAKVKVRILGDINGDGKVDIKDIAAVAVAFGSYPGLPRWNHSADLSQDGKIDIRDIALAARNFGKCS
ncbi:S8 family serine peptidase [Candidatus Bathyarchaeota archaeon]|nr:S8 family serine peptidase [Candidatus Bathyarchaeota archaeon]